MLTTSATRETHIADETTNVTQSISEQQDKKEPEKQQKRKTRGKRDNGDGGQGGGGRRRRRERVRRRGLFLLHNDFDNHVTYQYDDIAIQSSHIRTDHDRSTINLTSPKLPSASAATTSEVASKHNVNRYKYSRLLLLSGQRSDQDDVDDVEEGGREVIESSIRDSTAVVSVSPNDLITYNSIVTDETERSKTKTTSNDNNYYELVFNSSKCLS